MGAKNEAKSIQRRTNHHVNIDKNNIWNNFWIDIVAMLQLFETGDVLMV